MEKIKAFIEEKCEERGIEIDKITTSSLYNEGRLTVYLEEDSLFDLGRINAIVKSKWPEVKCEPVDDYALDIRFSINL